MEWKGNKSGGKYPRKSEDRGGEEVALSLFKLVSKRLPTTMIVPSTSHNKADHFHCYSRRKAIVSWPNAFPFSRGKKENDVISIQGAVCIAILNPFSSDVQFLYSHLAMLLFYVHLKFFE